MRSHHSRLVGPLFLGVALAATPQLTAQVGAPDRNQSRFWSSTNAIEINDQTTVRQEVITLTQPGTVYVQSDGYVSPIAWPTSTSADAWITVNGTRVSNVSVLHWNRSVAPQPHSYNVIGATSLPAGNHVIRLIADSRQGAHVIGPRSSLVVFVNPAANVQMDQTTQDTANLSFSMLGGRPERCEWQALGHHQVARIKLQNPELPVFAFGSARVFRATAAGDAMMGMFAEHANPQAELTTLFQSQFGVEDLWWGAEFHGPTYVQGVLTGTPPAEFDPAIVLGATQFPPGGFESLEYRVGAGATLVTMYGGMQVKGWAGNSRAEICTAQCIGGAAVGCPPLGTKVPISTATFTVPQGHDGRVLFSGKARCQGHPRDGPLQFFLELRIDGQIVGSLASQGLAGWLGGWDTTLSQRTLTTSYLATGANALSPGTHTVEVLAWAKSVTHPERTTRASIYDDAPFLVWID